MYEIGSNDRNWVSRSPQLHSKRKWFWKNPTEWIYEMHVSFCMTSCQGQMQLRLWLTTYVYIYIYIHIENLYTYKHTCKCIWVIKNTNLYTYTHTHLFTTAKVKYRIKPDDVVGLRKNLERKARTEQQTMNAKINKRILCIYKTTTESTTRTPKKKCDQLLPKQLHRSRQHTKDNV